MAAQDQTTLSKAAQLYVFSGKLSGDALDVAAVLPEAQMTVAFICRCLVIAACVIAVLSSELCCGRQEHPNVAISSLMFSAEREESLRITRVCRALCICKSVESREMCHVPVVSLRDGRGKRSEAMHAQFPATHVRYGLWLHSRWASTLACAARWSQERDFWRSVHCPGGWRGRVSPHQHCPFHFSFCSGF